VLTVTGDEKSWAWQPQGNEEIASCSSTELAARCVARLDAAYLEREVPLPHAQDGVSAT
jgi:hypothetical protein